MKMFRLDIILLTIVFIFGIERVIGRPSDGPTKIALGTEIIENNEDKTHKTPLKLHPGKEIFDRVADAIRIGRGRLVNSIILARNIIADETKRLVTRDTNTVQSNTNPLFNTAPVTRETVRLENETNQGILEKRFEHPIERVLENILRPTPLIDGIREEEKYGNSGDKFIGIGRALVGGFEGLSNFLNTIVDFPIDAAKKTSRGVTEALNQLGARLIGLQ